MLRRTLSIFAASTFEYQIAESCFAPAKFRTGAQWPRWGRHGTRTCRSTKLIPIEHFDSAEKVGADPSEHSPNVSRLGKSNPGIPRFEILGLLLVIDRGALTIADYRRHGLQCIRMRHTGRYNATHSTLLDHDIAEARCK